jgi:hypothetical protein
VGDPEVQPEYLMNFVISYDRKIGKQNISLTGSCRGENNAVSRVNMVLNENPAVFDMIGEDVLILSNPMQDTLNLWVRS